MWKNFQMNHGCLVMQPKMNYHSHSASISLSHVMITQSDKQFNYMKQQQSTTTTTTSSPSPRKQPDVDICQNQGIRKIDDSSQNYCKQNDNNMPKSNNQNKKRNRRRRRHRKKKQRPICDVIKPLPPSSTNTPQTRCQNICDVTGENVAQPHRRYRQISTTESEDSFVISFNDDLKCDSSGLDDDDDDDNDVENSSTGSGSVVPTKKVRFATQPELCIVHKMIKWAFAYQSARKGPWEECARDRARFSNRIQDCERILQPIFDRHHRTRIFQERFKDKH